MIATKPRYRGHIPRRGTDGGWYTVEIFLDTDAGHEDEYTTMRLDHPDTDPLVIEWDELKPETPLQGATATLRVISPGDRFFTRLYATRPGQVWMQVSHTRRPLMDAPGTPVWQGSLDPEFYEEPYERADGYDVELTFSDFAYMSRLKYSGSGMRSLDYVLRRALEDAGFPPSVELLRFMTSSWIESGEYGIIQDLTYCNSANWYDEEGEPLTVREVVEAMLRPLALHMTQRDGRIVVFDTHALWNTPARDVYWTSDTQTLAAAETYNNVRITFSPYADSDMTNVDFEYTGRTDTAYTWINYLYWPLRWDSAEDSDGIGMQFTVAYDVSQAYLDDGEIYDMQYASFALFVTSSHYRGLTIVGDYDSPAYDDDGLGFVTEADGRDYVGDRDKIAGQGWKGWPRAFKMIPFGSGDEAEGVAVSVTAGYGLLENAFGYPPKEEGGKAIGDKVFRYGVQPDTPWGYKNTARMLAEYLDDYEDDGRHYEALDWFCARTRERPLLTTDRVYLPPVDTAPVRVAGPTGDTVAASALRRTTHYIRLEVPMLLDCRYNPLTDATGYNQQTHQERMTQHTRWLFIPFTAVLYDDAGRIKYTYSNRRAFMQSGMRRLSNCEGEWVSRGLAGAIRTGVAPDSQPGLSRNPDYDKWGRRLYSHRAVETPDNPGAYLGEAWLSYHAADPVADGNSTGVGGWQSNRHLIGRVDVAPVYVSPFELMTYGKVDNPGNLISEPLTRLDAGQYIPYPPEGGYLEITLYAGMLGFDGKETVDMVNPAQWLSEDMCYDRGDGRRGIYNLIRWHLFKAPVIEIVRNDMSFDSAEMEDVEYSGYLDRAAHEELTIDTLWGTAPDPSPTARGLIYTQRVGTGGDIEHTPLREMTRGELRACPEKLLIGTLHSQFSRRRTTLTGEARLPEPDPGTPLRPWTDAAATDWWNRTDGGRTEDYPPIFWEESRTDNLRDATSTLTLVQIRPDTFTDRDIIEVED